MGKPVIFNWRMYLRSWVSTAEISLKPKLNQGTYCTCWCQGLAEVHFRRPTVNTLWMMRGQNQMANQALWKFTIKELSAMYLNRTFTLKGSNSVFDPNTAQSTQNAQGSLETAATAMNHQNGQFVNNKSALSPLCLGSHAREEYTTGEVGLKNPVQKSNSSSEVCSSWKVPFMNQHSTMRHSPFFTITTAPC